MEKLYYKIAEVSEILNIPVHTIRYWETEFKELQPKRNEKGKRFYTAEDIDVIREIAHLRYQKNLNITGTRSELKNNGGDAALMSKTKQKLISIRNQLSDIYEQL
ncbi:MAG: MerR family transcriptional regulator [Paludibacteraceae bacterium]|nr:MerR family transcriptional regulator [Paludibacteraceae bacterium]